LRGRLRAGVVEALSALSHLPGPQGLQVAHYWLARLLSSLAARTAPYTSLVYAEGPRDPADLVHAVPVLPSYVRSVVDALERAADAVADDSPSLPPHLEFDLAGSGLVGRPTPPPPPPPPAGAAGGGAGAAGGAKKGKNGAAVANTKEAAKKADGAASATGSLSSAPSTSASNPNPTTPPASTASTTTSAAAAAERAAYLAASQLVDMVLAESRAAEALEALCAIVAPDPAKQRWLLVRGVLPLLHRLSRTPAAAGPDAAAAGATVAAVNASSAAHSSSLLPSSPSSVAASGDPRVTSATEANAVSKASAETSKAAQQQQQQQGQGNQPNQPPLSSLPSATAPIPAVGAAVGDIPGNGGNGSGVLTSRTPPSQSTPALSSPAAAGAAEEAVEGGVVVSEVLSDHQAGPSLSLQRQ
ncbi:hypothetical protein Agub_g11250, partial [Astrephomene gubernaculifera]